MNDGAGDTESRGGIWAKILEDLFVFVQRTHFLSIFERKRGVQEKGKTENLRLLYGDLSFSGFSKQRT